MSLFQTQTVYREE